MKKIKILGITYLLLLAASVNGQVLSITNGTTNTSEEVALHSDSEESNDFIQVTPELFKKISDWQSKGYQQKTPLSELLSSLESKKGLESNSVEQQQMNKILKGIKSHFTKNNSNEYSKSGGDCGCVVVHVNSGPGTKTPYRKDTPDLTVLPRPVNVMPWYQEIHYGAATSQSLQIDSKNAYRRSFAQSFQLGSYDNQNSSFTQATLSYNYVCTNGSMLPSNCNCDKTISIEAEYDSKIQVSIGSVTTGKSTAGVGVFDMGVLCSVDVNNFTTNNAEITVLKAAAQESKLLYDTSLNFDYLRNLNIVANQIVSLFNEEDDDIDWQSKINEIIDGIEDVYEENLFKQENYIGTKYKNNGINYEGNIVLKPNHTVKLRLFSTGYVTAKGTGKYLVNAKRSSGYSLSGVLPFNDANPECCLEKFANWSMGSIDASNYPGLEMNVEAHLNLWKPWSSLNVNSQYQNVNISARDGIAYNTDSCPKCILDDFENLTVNPNGNPTQSITNVLFDWDDMFGVEKYRVTITASVYDKINHIILPEQPFATFEVTNSQASYAIPKNSSMIYFYTVTAICPNGDTKTSSKSAFQVKWPVNISNNSNVALKKANDQFVIDVTPVIVSPNPFKENFKITVNGATHITPAKVEVYNNSGQLIYHSIMTTNELEINSSTWGSGMYLCKVLINEKEVKTHKLIKM